MSKIPYYFETPVPKYFREAGWFDNENTFKFVTWSFSKCQSVSHKEIIFGREIILAPFEFIAGRLTSPKECFLSENVFRNQINQLLTNCLLVKSTNSLTNKYSCYIWVTERFSINNNQQNNQQITNRQPTDNHKERTKNIRTKESHHPYPSSKVLPLKDADLIDMTDDFSFLTQDSSKTKSQHKFYNQTMSAPTEILKGVFISKEDLEKCISIKGSLEKVKYAMEYIMRSPGRKRKIYDWPNTLANWDIKADIKPRIIENEEMTKRLESQNSQNAGWRCERHVDTKKDLKGILFYAISGNTEPVFVPFIDHEFKDKVSKVLRDKKMQQGRIIETPKK